MIFLNRYAAKLKRRLFILLVAECGVFLFIGEWDDWYKTKEKRKKRKAKRMKRR